MNAFEHGGDWAAYEYMYKKKPPDFSANVCPLGIPLAGMSFGTVFRVRKYTWARQTAYEIV